MALPNLLGGTMKDDWETKYYHLLARKFELQKEYDRLEEEYKKTLQELIDLKLKIEKIYRV